jgi:hypothetical protein
MSASLPPEKRISKETLLTISVLLPKLHEVRDTHTQGIPLGAIADIVRIDNGPGHQ